MQLLIPSTIVNSDPGDGSYGDHLQTRASRAGVDVELYGFSLEDNYIVPGIALSKLYHGLEANLSFFVANIGTAHITTSFKVQVTILDDPDEVNATYKIQMNRTVNELNSHEFEQLHINWTPPLNPPPGAAWNYSDTGNHTFILKAKSLYGSDDNNSNNELSTNLTVFEANFAPEITNKLWYGGDVYEHPILNKVDLGGILYLNFTVNNTAVYQDFIKLEIFDLPPDWTLLPGSLPSFLQLQGMKGLEVNIRIQISRNHSLALKSVDYKINIRAERHIFVHRQCKLQPAGEVHHAGRCYLCTGNALH
jgi:hypothetical protein